MRGEEKYMACIPIKKYLKNNEDMAYDSYGTNRWKLISMEYLDALFSGFSFEGTKLHEELMELILHLFKSNPLKFNEKENLYSYEFKCSSWIYRYYPNGLIVKYINYEGRNNLFACNDKNDDIIAYKPYELPERIKKEIEEKAKEAEEKAKEKLKKEIKTEVKKSISLLKRNRNSLVIPSYMSDFAKYSLAYYQCARKHSIKGYTKIPKVTKYPIYKIIEGLKMINEKLNQPVEVKGGEEGLRYSLLYRNKIISVIQDGIQAEIRKEALKFGICNANSVSLFLEKSSLNKIFATDRLDYSPLGYLEGFRTVQEIDSWAKTNGEKGGKIWNLNDDIHKKYNEMLREGDIETKENYFYYDHKINRNPITPGSIVKLIPNNQLYYVILAYDKLVEFVKTLPFGEEWMIRNTIIPPSEDDKKGEK